MRENLEEGVRGPQQFCYYHVVIFLLYSAVQQPQKPENTLLEYLNAILDSVIIGITTPQHNYLPSHSLFSLEISTFGDPEKSMKSPFMILHFSPMVVLFI